MPISSEGRRGTLIFYAFTGAHSLLIGLFLFYVPVYLWKRGFDLADISAFIATVGLSFCVTLWLWDRLRGRLSFSNLITASFFIEVMALSIVFAAGYNFFWPFFALLLGAYNCFFWIIQRLLFVGLISPDNSGRHFGNFQIYVAIILKIGILTGGFMLERYGFATLYLLSIIFALGGAVGLRLLPEPAFFAGEMGREPPLALADLWRFKDRAHSRIIFALDGFFLYLESYFWLISLFLLVKKSFFHLGLLIILLAVIFSILFFLIKNRIDAADKQKVYYFAVILYMAGWYLRAFVDEGTASTLLYSLLIIITFCTSFFRLVFNKRFFDYAKGKSGYKYILLKSYYSQFFIGLIFTGLAGCYALFPQPILVTRMLGYTYYAAGGLVLLYLLYPIVPLKNR